MTLKVTMKAPLAAAESMSPDDTCQIMTMNDDGDGDDDGNGDGDDDGYRMAYRSDPLVDNLQMNLRDTECFQSIRYR